MIFVTRIRGLSRETPEGQVHTNGPRGKRQVLSSSDPSPSTGSWSSLYKMAAFPQSPLPSNEARDAV